MQFRAGERVLKTFGYRSFDFNDVKWALVSSEQLQTERKACKLGKSAENPGWLVASTEIKRNMRALEAAMDMHERAPRVCIFDYIEHS